MRNKMILAGKPSVLDLLSKRGEAVPPENRHIWVASMPFSRLIPLTWRTEVAYENSNNWAIQEVAASLLHLDGHAERQADYMQRQSKHTMLTAAPGDFIVIMPLVGGFNGAIPGRVTPEQIRRHLEHDGNHVDVLYIGETLPADVNAVFQPKLWLKVVLPAALSVFDRAVRENKSKTITVFDALRSGMCVPGVERFQKRFFPGRIECTVEELYGFIIAQPEVRQVLEHFLGVRSDNRDRYGLISDAWFAEVRRQRAPLAKKLALEEWN